MPDPHLIFVGTSESLAKRLFEEDDLPEWFPSPERDDNALLTMQRWDETKAVLHVMVWAKGDQHVVRTQVSALYDDVPLDTFTDEEREEFARSHTQLLMPFVQQAVFTASSQVWPVQPILLDIRAGKTIIHERLRQDSETQG